MSHDQQIKTVKREALLPFPWSMPQRQKGDIAPARTELDVDRCVKNREMRAWLHTFVDEETGCGSPPPMN